MAKKIFVPFLNEPSYSAKWWRTKAGGGISPCIAGSPNYCSDKHSSLANCVGWSWGRMAMLEDDINCKIGCWRGNGFPCNAENWIEASKQQNYEIGTEPRLGAVACWIHKSGEWGHVANVELINKDGSWLSSESAWNSYYWKSLKYSKTCYKANYKFLGFIYPRDEWYIPEKEDLKVGDSVEIVGTGNASSYGDGWTAYGIGYKRKILKIYVGRPYPYRVGNDYGTTGFYTAESLKKI